MIGEIEIAAEIVTASGTRTCLLCEEKITEQTLLVGFSPLNSYVRKDITFHVDCALRLWEIIGEKIGAVIRDPREKDQTEEVETRRTL